MKDGEIMTEKHDVIIDPRKESYCFTFSRHDCYKLATGRCTFELTDEEYEKENAKSNSPYNYHYKARVGYCRGLLEKMRDGGDISATKRTGIYAHSNACGHMTLSSGQHRSCIAKKNQLPKLHLNTLGDNGEYLCRSCYIEKDEAQKQRSFWDNFKRKKKENINKDVPIDITDDKL
ncbi:hypothetical protein ACQKNX_08025 [Lysinibacillus sp. NPDC093712]|uniref:hypothetical protein n=1 Tax=Lysinibacillus sp. NPDC093712 TaxID=3390579 RepID=UPI003D03D030